MGSQFWSNHLNNTGSNDMNIYGQKDFKQL